MYKIHLLWDVWHCVTEQVLPNILENHSALTALYKIWRYYNPSKCQDPLAKHLCHFQNTLIFSNITVRNLDLAFSCVCQNTKCFLCSETTEDHKVAVCWQDKMLAHSKCRLHNISKTWCVCLNTMTETMLLNNVLVRYQRFITISIKYETLTYLLNAWLILNHQYILKISLTSFLKLVNKLGTACTEVHCEWVAYLPSTLIHIAACSILVETLHN
jgi:hypothetical protein